MKVGSNSVSDSNISVYSTLLMDNPYNHPIQILFFTFHHHLVIGVTLSFETPCLLLRIIFLC